MITREDLEHWNSIIEPRGMSQAVINAAEKIRDGGFKIDPKVPYRDLAQSAFGLADRMRSSTILRGESELRTSLYTATLEVFDSSTMAKDLDCFEEMFAYSVDELRLQRDTNRCDTSALPRLTSTLARNAHLMRPDTYRKLLTDSISFTIQYRKNAPVQLGTSLFFGADNEMKGYTQLFNDMIISSLLKQEVGAESSTELLGSPGRLDHALRTASTIAAIDDAEIIMQAWQVDRLLIVQATERLVQAHKAASSIEDQEVLVRGITAITNVFTRPVGAPPLIGGNCFRPPLYPKDWKVWMDDKPMEMLTHHLTLALKSMGHSSCPDIEEAVGRHRLQLLIDATVCAKSLAPKGGKQSKSRQATANAIGNFVRDLIDSCQEPMSRKGALNGLTQELKAVLIGLLPMGEVRRGLLRANKNVKGQVLMDDLGM